MKLTPLHVVCYNGVFFLTKGAVNTLRPRSFTSSVGYCKRGVPSDFGLLCKTHQFDHVDEIFVKSYIELNIPYAVFIWNKNDFIKFKYDFMQFDWWTVEFCETWSWKVYILITCGYWITQARSQSVDRCERKFDVRISFPGGLLRTTSIVYVYVWSGIKLQGTCWNGAALSSPWTHWGPNKMTEILRVE